MPEEFSPLPGEDLHHPRLPAELLALKLPACQPDWQHLAGIALLPLWAALRNTHKSFQPSWRYIQMLAEGRGHSCRTMHSGEGKTKPKHLLGMQASALHSACVPRQKAAHFYSCSYSRLHLVKTGHRCLPQLRPQYLCGPHSTGSRALAAGPSAALLPHIALPHLSMPRQ